MSYETEAQETPQYLNKWKRADNYIGADFSEYYVVYTRHRDSDVYERANYDSIKEELEEYEGFEESSASHWAVGWLDHILMHEDDEDGVWWADFIAKKLEDYPIYDEDKLHEYERQDEEQALTDWVLSDLWSDLVKEHREEFEQVMDYESDDYWLLEDVESPEDGPLTHLLYSLMEASNTYWEHEPGGPWVPTERLATYSTLTDLLEIAPSEIAETLMAEDLHYQEIRITDLWLEAAGQERLPL